MTKPTFFLIFLSSLLLFGGSLTVNAQNTTQFQEDDEKAIQPKQANILQQLDLSRQQLNQIRLINQQFRPPLRQSNLRLKAANQALDDAIYSDQADETLIQSRLRDAQSAHAEWIKNRTRLESEISKVLNQDQLARFRQFRRQNRVKNNRNRLLNNQAPPVQRLNRLPKQMQNRPLQRRNN